MTSHADLNDNSANNQGGKLRLVFLTWIGVYPILTIIALLLHQFFQNLPVVLSTLIMSAIMVPIMVLGVMPKLVRWF